MEKESTPWGEYRTQEEALTMLPLFKKYEGQEVIQNKTGNKVTISHVTVHPFTWFENGVELNRGYDIRLHIKGTNFFLTSKNIMPMIGVS